MSQLKLIKWRKENATDDNSWQLETGVDWSKWARYNRARRQSGFPTFVSCQRQDANVLPKRRQSHQGDKLCDVSTVPLVARWPVFLARGSDADGEPHYDVCSDITYIYNDNYDVLRNPVSAALNLSIRTVVFFPDIRNA